MNLIKVRIMRGFCLGGGRDVFPGAVVELPENEARLRIVQGKAAPYELPDPEPETETAPTQEASQDKRRTTKKL